MNRQWLLIGSVAIAAAWAGFYFGMPTPVTPSSIPAAASATLAELKLPTAEGQMTDLKQWSGKVIVLNFWATWCPPCREEMPEFSHIQQKFAANSVQFVGIGIDTPDNILDFKKTNPVSYPLLMGSYDTLKLTAELGNKAMALPFTVILDRNGRIAHTQLGKMDGTLLEKALTPLMPTPPPVK